MASTWLGRRFSFDRLFHEGSVALITVMILLPVGFLAYASLSTGLPGQSGGLTLHNVKAVYGSAKYLGSLRDTVLLSLATSAVVTPIGALFAWLVVRTDIRGRRPLQGLLIVPLLISSLLGTLAWIALAAPSSGLINAWIGHGIFHLHHDLVDIYSVPGIVFVMVLYYVPNGYLFTVGAFARVDGTLEDAARVNGMSPFTTFVHITLRLVAPAIASSALLTFVLAAENFPVPTLLGVRGHFSTIPLAMYNGFTYGSVSPGEVAALGSLLVWVTGVGFLLQRRMVRIGGKYVSMTGKPTPPRPTALGRWRTPASSLVWIYVALSVIFPCVALILGSLQRFMSPTLALKNFTFSNYSSLINASQLHALANTVGLSAGSATVCVIFGLLFAAVIVRQKGNWGRTADYVSSLPIAIPGLSIAVGMLWAYAFLPLPIYGTIWILAIGYITRFVPYSVRIGSSALEQVDPSLEDAGRIAGLSRSGTLAKITRQLLKPSIVAAWTLIFIYVVVEATVTILLYTPQSTTLSVVLWNSMEVSGTTLAFAVGVLQLFLIGAVLWFARRLSGGISMQIV